MVALNTSFGMDLKNPDFTHDYIDPLNGSPSKGHASVKRGCGLGPFFRSGRGTGRFYIFRDVCS